MEGAGVFDVDGRSIRTGLLSISAGGDGVPRAAMGGLAAKHWLPDSRLASLNLQGLNLLTVGLRRGQSVPITHRLGLVGGD